LYNILIEFGTPMELG